MGQVCSRRDISKTFDNVSHEKLFNSLPDSGFPNCYQSVDHNAMIDYLKFQMQPMERVKEINSPVLFVSF